MPLTPTATIFAALRSHELAARVFITPAIQDVGVCVDPDEIAVHRRDLHALATQTRRRQEQHSHRKHTFAVYVDPDEIFVCRRDLGALPTQTGHRQKKHSCRAPNFGVCVDPHEIIVRRREPDAPPTQTGRRRESRCRSTDIPDGALLLHPQPGPDPDRKKFSCACRMGRERRPRKLAWVYGR